MSAIRLPPGIDIEGHAIASADGMIADRTGAMPDPLRNQSDWRRFQQALDAAALVVLGRKGHARHPNPGRRRLVLTTGVADLMPDPADPMASLWNPATLGFAEALTRLELEQGTVAVTGGTAVFDHFLPYYRRFILSEVNIVRIEGGTPCFTAGHPRRVLAGCGLSPHRFEFIDAAGGVTSTLWAA